MVTGNGAAAAQRYDAVIIGAGFAGMYMQHKLRSIGMRVRVLEQGGDVGGAWYWNRYPGARCDVESLVYSYSFSPILDDEWRWSERYAAQPEIQAYLRFVSERLDLRRDISFNSRVTAAAFQSSSKEWRIDTEQGEVLTATYCIMATGPISKPILPDIPGIQNFKGEFYHTAQWPQVDPKFAGKRVGVIGTGSSGTQLIPVVAKEAGRLIVLLRTPNYTIPARNHPMTEADYAKWIEKRQEIRDAMVRGEIGGSGDVLMDEELRRSRVTPASEYTPEQRRSIIERRWAVGGAVVMTSFKDVMTNAEVNEEVSEYVRSQIRSIVKDPVKADMLTPKGYALGTKRPCVDTGFYEAFNRDNVEIVDVKTHPIERVTEKGIVTNGKEIELDVLIFATGFDALTGALTAIDLRGKNGQSINDVWKDGPHTYLGMCIAGFPNMFMIGGPGSPSVLTNVVRTNEFQVDYLVDLIQDNRDRGYNYIEATQASTDKWTEHVNEVVKASLLANANSWYVGANVPGKPRVILAYTGGIVAYRGACMEAKEGGYPGFARHA